MRKSVIGAPPLLFLVGVAVWLGYRQGGGADGGLGALPWLMIAAVVVGLVLLTVVKAERRRVRWPVRVLYGCVTAVLLAQLFIVAEVERPEAAADAYTAEAAMLVVATRLQVLSDAGLLPDDPRRLDHLLAGLPPFGGKEGVSWRLEIHECATASDLPDDVTDGVALLCLAPDRSRGWLAWSERGMDAGEPAATPRRLEVEAR